MRPTRKQLGFLRGVSKETHAHRAGELPGSGRAENVAGRHAALGAQHETAFRSASEREQGG